MLVTTRLFLKISLPRTSNMHTIIKMYKFMITKTNVSNKMHMNYTISIILLLLLLLECSLWHLLSLFTLFYLTLDQSVL